MDPSVKIARWLKPLVFPSNPAKALEGKPDKVDVKHVNVNDKTASVREVQVTAETEADVSDLARELSDFMADDAEGLGGTQRYVVSAYLGEKCLARLALRYHGADKDDEVVVSEGTSARGQLAQTQRHLEAVMRINAQKDGAAWGAMERIIARLEAQNNDMAEKHFEVLKLVEELSTTRHEREMDMLERGSKIVMKEKMAGAVTPLLQAFAGKVTGKVSSEDPRYKAFQSLLANLTPEQFEKIATTLDPIQFTALSAIIDDGAAQEEKEERAKNGAS